MKKLLSLTVVAGMVAFAACKSGGNAEQKLKDSLMKDSLMKDSIAKVEAEQKVKDSLIQDSITKVKADSIKKDSIEKAGKAPKKKGKK
ncbi:MAG: hypothetical protein WC223_03520 [Bacteroidales bacterium]|jgi:hypothetical protein